MIGKSSQSQSSYIIDGDDGFTGLNSKDTPTNLQKGIVSKSQNFRLERGEAILRKGCKKLNVFGETEKRIYASCLYSDDTGVDKIVLVAKEGIYFYDPNAETTSGLFPYGDEVDFGDSCTHVYQAQGVGFLYLNHGFDKATYKWEPGNTELTPFVANTSTNPGSYNTYPNSEFATYFGNRHIVKTYKNAFSASSYLEDNTYSVLDMFYINEGDGDTLIAITPWQLNEFVIFMRNSIFYGNIGLGSDAYADPATEDNSYVKSLATDIGCLARRSIVQALGGIVFLTDNGVFMLNPAGATQGKQKSDGSVTAGNTPEGMRLLTGTEPLSMPINDIIQRINFEHADKAVGIYFENRYYLAVPIDDSTDNNVILVYNFLIKSWESVDTYPPGFDSENLIVCRYGNKRRLFSVDSTSGLLLLEELEYDSYVNIIGTPRIPFILGNVQESTIDNSVIFPYQIDGVLITRGYNFGSEMSKKISSVISHINKPADSVLEISVITTNPDTEASILTISENISNDSIYRIPVRKSGYYAQVKFKSSSNRPSIKMVKLKGILSGENIHINS